MIIRPNIYLPFQGAQATGTSVTPRRRYTWPWAEFNWAFSPKNSRKQRTVMARRPTNARLKTTPPGEQRPEGATHFSPMASPWDIQWNMLFLRPERAG